MPFRDRRDAGQRLVAHLQRFKHAPQLVVIGLPRGGVIVAEVVARALGAPLDCIVPRKIGAPENPEFAIGAIMHDGTAHINADAVAAYHISETYIAAEAHTQQREAQRRLQLYRGGRPELDLRNKTVLIVDDGIATGYTMRAACAFAKQQGPSRIIVAVPVAARDAVEELRSAVDEVIVDEIPEFFGAVGQFYNEFPEVSDDEVIAALERH